MDKPEFHRADTTDPDGVEPSKLRERIAEPKQLLDMDTSVLSQVHFVGNRIQVTGSASYRKWFGIGISEFRLLVVISNQPGSSGADIHKIMGLDLGAISRSLRKMEAKGLVVSAAHARHPSYRRWYVTARGASLHDRICVMTAKREQALLKGFSKAEVFQLLSYLHRLFENADELARIAEQGDGARDSDAASCG